METKEFQVDQVEGAICKFLKTKEGRKEEQLRIGVQDRLGREYHKPG
jgi:hypothetical protein